MNQVISLQNAEHYVWGGQCDGWHLVRTPDLSVMQERVPPGGQEVRHAHALARQFFFVLFLVISQPPSHGDRVDEP